MSHLTKIETRILSLTALESAVKEMGATLTRDSKTFTAYNRSPCDHRITLPGVRYEIGVRREQDGAYTLHADLNAGDGNLLVLHFGNGLNKLTQTCAAHAAIEAARRKGWMVHRQNLPGGKIKITCTGIK